MQNLIPDMWQMVLANISIQGWIIDPNVESFFDGSHEVLVLSPHYADVIYVNHMTRDAIVVIDGGWGLLVFFEPLSKSSGGLSYILLITLHSIIFVSIDAPLFFSTGSWALGAIRRFLMVTPPLKNTCTPCLLQVLFTLLLSPW